MYVALVCNYVHFDVFNQKERDMCQLGPPEVQTCGGDVLRSTISFEEITVKKKRNLDVFLGLRRFLVSISSSPCAEEGGSSPGIP